MDVDSCSQGPNEPCTFTDHWLAELDPGGHRQVLTLFEIALVVLSNKDLLSCDYLSVKFLFIFIMLLLFSEMKVGQACHLWYYTCYFSSLHFDRRTASLGSVCREKFCSRELPWAQPWPWCLPGCSVGQQLLQPKTTESISSYFMTIVTVDWGWRWGNMVPWIKTVLAKMCNFKQLDIPK